MTPDDPRHGTTNGYKNLHCRCQPCRDAASAWMSEYRTRGGGRDALTVNHRARDKALKLFIAECPDLWREIQDETWVEVTGRPPRPVGRPPKQATP